MSEYRRTFFGNEVTASRVYKAGGWRGDAKVMRDGALVESFDESDVETAVERAWCFACMHRHISLHIGGDLVSSWLSYMGPGATSPARIFTATTQAEVEEAERVFRGLLLEQWTRELAEHERRRESLPAHVQVLGGELADVLAKMDPLKAEKKRIESEIARAPSMVFAIDIEDNTIASLAERMASAASDEIWSSSIRDVVAKPPADFEQPPAANDEPDEDPDPGPPPSVARRSKRKPPKNRGGK